MRKHNLPLTYPPKIEAVKEGRCIQTIRVGRKFSERDLVSFHGWEGRPYHSKWSFHTRYFVVCAVGDITIYPDGIDLIGTGAFHTFGKSEWLNHLAKMDFIDPPTGEELGNVLKRYHKIDESGLESQIVRWMP